MTESTQPLPDRPGVSATCTNAGEVNVDPRPESACALWITRLLLSGAGASADNLDWEMIRQVAQSNRVLLRTGAALTRAGVALPRFVEDALAEERVRVRAMLDVAGTVSRVCRTNHIRCVVAKAFAHLPDIGADLDIILDAEPTQAHSVLGNAIGATRSRWRLERWIARRSVYVTSKSPGAIDFHFGRLGQLGECVEVTRSILDRGVTVVVDDIEMTVPSVEDRLVLQVIHRMYGGHAMRIADVVLGVHLLQHPDLDWDYIRASLAREGMQAGLAAYVYFIGRIRENATGCRLSDAITSEVPGALHPRGDVRFDKLLYRLPAFRLNAQLYVQAFTRRALSFDLRGAGRLSLLPVVAAARLIRRVLRQEDPPLAWVGLIAPAVTGVP